MITNRTDHTRTCSARPHHARQGGASLGIFALALAMLVWSAPPAIAAPPFALTGFAPVARSVVDPQLAISTSRSDAEDGVVIGRLLGARLRVGTGTLPLEEAIAAFGDAVGVRTLIAFAGARDDLGRAIDFEELAPTGDDPVPALELLERMVARGRAAGGVRRLDAPAGESVHRARARHGRSDAPSLRTIVSVATVALSASPPARKFARAPASWPRNCCSTSNVTSNRADG